ncbi:RecB family exonuclease [Paraoerskovia marina]|uniref:RecB family exonuclease n=1 Tax=Paraoerskovia marina TaxID=545619 RepID=UPI000492888C|nr:PD-(D/E)XK nuclease family protein [Paraoerskovia marina]
MTATSSTADGDPAYVPGLSPSRANDFMQCPLLFRFRVVDRLPEPPSEAAARGTLVHSVLEELYDLPLGGRTPEAAQGLLPAAWESLRSTNPQYAELVTGAEELDRWLADAGRLVSTYFTLEDPNRLEPAGRELRVSSDLPDGPRLRGVIDRLDVAPDGALRVVDYKSGKSPRPAYQGSALFQMRFYGLVLWRERGEVPRMLQLVYLGDGRILRAEPTRADLEATEAKVRALWEAIRTAGRTGGWTPRRSALCGWCAHQAICPEFGGTPPPVPEGRVEVALGVRPDRA